MAIDEALVARCVALVRNMANDHYDLPCGTQQEARAIVALLPEPIDSDLIEAREICAVMAITEHLRDDLGISQTGHDREGGYDGREVRIALAGIRKGRELAAQEAGK